MLDFAEKILDITVCHFIRIPKSNIILGLLKFEKLNENLLFCCLVNFEGALIGWLS